MGRGQSPQGSQTVGPRPSGMLALGNDRNLEVCLNDAPREMGPWPWRCQRHQRLCLTSKQQVGSLDQKTLTSRMERWGESTVMMTLKDETSDY